MESSRLSSKKPLGIKELYAEWSKNLTHYCLPLLGDSIHTDPQAILPDTDVANIMNYLTKHYETLSASYDNNDTIRNTLFPSGNETQLFFVGDVHPCLFTSLVRSLIDATWKETQVRMIDETERRMMVRVGEITEQMSKAQVRFVARVSKNWVSSEKTEDSSSVVAVDEAAKEEKEELVRIFSAANSLRKDVLKDIFKATTGIQAAKFLESLCHFLSGFKDQQQQHHTPEPSPSHDMEQQQHTSEADESQKRTLWIGSITDDMDTEFLYRCFSKTGEVLYVHLPTNKVTGKGVGFGFIEFISPEAAERALQTYNKTLIPGMDPPRRFKLGWSTKGIVRESTETLFVGDLAGDVTDQMLLKTFTDNGYSSAVSAKVSTEGATGRNRGYGFVRFSDHGQMLLALERMNGVECSGRPMTVGPTRANLSSLAYDN